MRLFQIISGVELQTNASLKLSNEKHSTIISYKSGFECILGDEDALRMSSSAIKWDGVEISNRVQMVAVAGAENNPDYFLYPQWAKNFRLKSFFADIMQCFEHFEQET